MKYHANCDHLLFSLKKMANICTSKTFEYWDLSVNYRRLRAEARGSIAKLFFQKPKAAVGIIHFEITCAPNVGGECSCASIEIDDCFFKE